MNSILVRSTPERRTPPAGRVLAIEPDEERANLLRSILPPPVDLRIVRTTKDAVRCISEAVPDLIATSSFLPPQDEAMLADHLRNTPGGAHVQVIEVPYFIDAGEAPAARSRGALGFLRRRKPSVRPRCDERMLREHIQQFLAQGLARKALALEPAAGTGRDEAPAPRQTSSASGPRLSIVRFPGFGGGGMLPPDRRHARRRRGDELSSIWGIRLPWGAEARVLDISNSGVLLESGVKMTPGTTVDLHLLGQGTDVCVPSRAVRTEVGQVDSSGVRYQVAAAFSRELDLRGLERTAPPQPDTRMLTEVLTNVLAGARRPGEGSPRARFEAELRRIFKVRDIQVRERPLAAAAGSESIYFTVPQAAGGAPWILQVTFEPDYMPSAGEFRLLKTAASLAAVVLEYDPPSADTVDRRATG